MGVQYRLQYPNLYADNDPFILWANRYQGTQSRVTDSARLFARGLLGPNATTLGSVLVINQTDPRSIANSLAPSDLCPNFKDNSGGENVTIWRDVYLPPIVSRINSRLHGLQFNSSDVVIFPYLCGFETQITGRRSPWCDVFTSSEIEQYEYEQDLRYYYGGVIASDLGPGMMLPVLRDIVGRFQAGPARRENRLMAMFTNDGQINQLSAAIGVFDSQRPLPAAKMDRGRVFRSSFYVTMRGTLSFERLNCGQGGKFVRVKLNDVVYPVVGCASGPGQSCGLDEYERIVEEKQRRFGSFATRCGINGTAPEKASFLEDSSLPYIYSIQP